MASERCYVLIPGAGGVPWHWHRVAAELRRHGHDVVDVDLPNDDPAAGLAEYADAVVRAARGRTGAASSPIRWAGSPRRWCAGGYRWSGWCWWRRCRRRPARHRASGGRTPATARRRPSGSGWTVALRTDALFYHDVPPEPAAEARSRERAQSGGPFGRPWPLVRRPETPASFPLCRDDRFPPAAWLRGLVRERLGTEPEERDGGHVPLLSRPRELAERVMRLSGG
ncbi:alpha/beta hydrolase [Streptomyces chrestomyceticus]|uniref:alpha/beta hydrolase n=1 Tax=Streptomyces chrestomyceticus TaxID=68185 RepID=UPI00340DA1A7